MDIVTLEAGDRNAHAAAIEALDEAPQRNPRVGDAIADHAAAPIEQHQQAQRRRYVVRRGHRRTNQHASSEIAGPGMGLAGRVDLAQQGETATIERNPRLQAGNIDPRRAPDEGERRDRIRGLGC